LRTAGTGVGIQNAFRPSAVDDAVHLQRGALERHHQRIRKALTGSPFSLMRANTRRMLPPKARAGIANQM
jgi:hypothetical protein